MSADDSTSGEGSVLDDYGDDDSFHPLGSDWESEMEAQLDDTEYDTELGLEMAKDAMRVTAGELSEAEFHAKYHERVLDEFGVDDRPTAEAFEEAKAKGKNIFDRLADVDGDDEASRRNVMKKMGAGAAFLGLGAWSTIEDPEPEPEEPSVAAAQEEEAAGDEGTQWGMVIDLERCDACLQCVAGCQAENGWDQGMNWMYVLSWEDDNNQVPEDASPQEMNHLVRPCQHCTEAPCEKVCPTTARHTRQKDGLVLTDYDVCIGCRYCQVACPYGVNYFQWDEPSVPRNDLDEDHIYADYSEEGEEEDPRRVDSRAPKGVMSKCTMCPSRQDGNHGEEQVGTVACMDACDAAGMSAIHFGDMNDPESRPNQYLDARVEQEREQGPNFEEPDEEWLESTTDTGNISAFRLLEGIGTEPNIVYLGDEPGANAHQVEGPVAYEDIGQTDARKDVTDEGTVGGDLFS